MWKFKELISATFLSLSLKILNAENISFSYEGRWLGWDKILFMSASSLYENVTVAEKDLFGAVQIGPRHYMQIGKSYVSRFCNITMRLQGEWMPQCFLRRLNMDTRYRFQTQNGFPSSIFKSYSFSHWNSKFLQKPDIELVIAETGFQTSSTLAWNSTWISKLRHPVREVGWGFGKHSFLLYFCYSFCNISSLSPAWPNICCYWSVAEPPS